MLWEIIEEAKKQDTRKMVFPLIEVQLFRLNWRTTNCH